jgi:hypothetical protein
MKKTVVYYLLALIVFALAAQPALAQERAQRSVNEEEKISLLIQHVRGLENAMFIRNGMEFKADKAAEHLQGKRAKAGKRISTARHFIKYVAAKSSSGKPYQIRYADGRVVNVEEVLAKELDRIESRETGTGL